MAGSTNFQQFNPGATNQENDAAYTADTTRSGGVVVDQLLPSPLLNKVWFQSSTFIAAIAQALANKGYALSDSNLGTLTGVLANIVTDADLASSPALGGNPTATTQAFSDNSTRIASTAFVQSVIADSPALGGNPTATTQSPSDNSTRVASTAFVQAVVVAAISAIIQGSSLTNPGFINLLGFILQWGTVDFGSSMGVGLYGPYNFPIAFPNACLNIQFNTLTASANTENNQTQLPLDRLPTTTQFYFGTKCFGGIDATSRGVDWFAVGF